MPDVVLVAVGFDLIDLKFPTIPTDRDVVERALQVASEWQLAVAFHPAEVVCLAVPPDKAHEIGIPVGHGNMLLFDECNFAGTGAPRLFARTVDGFARRTHRGKMDLKLPIS
jgi:hypothetical protein